MTAPVRNLDNPAGFTAALQGRNIRGVAELNALRHADVRDPEIDSRITASELAFRIQSAAPELMDLSGESQATLDMYGVNRSEPKIEGGNQLGGTGIKGGQVVGETYDIACNVTKEQIHLHDLHATILHQFGFDHTKLTYRFHGRDYRLTDVAGHVVKKLLA